MHDTDKARTAIQDALSNATTCLTDEEIREEVDYWFEIRAEDGSD